MSRIGLDPMPQAEQTQITAKMRDRAQAFAHTSKPEVGSVSSCQVTSFAGCRNLARGVCMLFLDAHPVKRDVWESLPRSECIRAIRWRCRLSTIPYAYPAHSSRRQFPLTWQTSGWYLPQPILR